MQKRALNHTVPDSLRIRNSQKAEGLAKHGHTPKYLEFHP